MWCVTMEPAWAPGKCRAQFCLSMEALRGGCRIDRGKKRWHEARVMSSMAEGPHNYRMGIVPSALHPLLGSGSVYPRTPTTTMNCVLHGILVPISL